MRQFFIFLIWSHFVSDGFAQDKLAVETESPAWGISLTPNLLQRASIENRGGKYNLESSPQFGGEILIRYYYNFLPGYRLVFGGGFNWLSYDFDYDIPKDIFTPPTGVNISSNQAPSRYSDIFHLRGQIDFEKIFLRPNKKSVIVALGLSLLYSPQDHEGNREVLVYPGGSSVTFLYRDQTNNNNNRPWINLHLSGGPEWIIGRRQKLQVLAKANFSPVKFLKGTYYVEVGNEPIVTGEYGLTGSYLGISVTYIISKPPTH